MFAREWGGGVQGEDWRVEPLNRPSIEVASAEHVRHARGLNRGEAVPAHMLTWKSHVRVESPRPGCQGQPDPGYGQAGSVTPRQTALSLSRLSPSFSVHFCASGKVA